MRRLLCIFLLMMLSVQSFAMHAGEPAAHGYDVAHELDHLAGNSHHHHGSGSDGDVHYDESSESDRHFSEHSSSCHQTATLHSWHAPQVQLGLLSVLTSTPPHYLAGPVLEQPQRPPQALG